MELNNSKKKLTENQSRYQHSSTKLTAIWFFLTDQKLGPSSNKIIRILGGFVHHRNKLENWKFYEPHNETKCKCKDLWVETVAKTLTKI